MMNKMECEVRDFIKGMDGVFEEMLNLAGVGKLKTLEHMNPDEAVLLIKTLYLYQNVKDRAVKTGEFMDQMMKKLDDLERQNNEILRKLEEKTGA